MEENIQNTENLEQVNNEQPAATENIQNENNAPEIDYNKLADIITKGTQSKEDAILKSYFQQVGMTKEEVGEAVKAYKEKQASKINEEKQNIENLRNELNSLKSTLKNERLNNTVNSISKELGLDEKALKAVKKLCDFDALTKDEVDSAKIKETFVNTLREYPGLIGKVADEKIGTPKSQDDVMINEKLDELFGITKKQTVETKKEDSNLDKLFGLL